MTLSKTIGHVIVLLVICTSLDHQGHAQSLNVFSQEASSSKTSSIHVREKRETSLKSTDYEIQATVGISDLESLQALLNTLTFPLLFSNSIKVDSMGTTTVCSVHTTGYQCTCEESFAWSLDSCINHEACDAIVGDTCGCINGLPADGQYCQSNTTESRTFSFSMNMEYDPSFNEPSHAVYQDINNTIQNQVRTHFPAPVSAQLIGFRNGSTIATYTVIATSFPETQTEALKVGLFTNLAQKYSMIYDSETLLQFNPTEVFFGRSVTVTCGPPPGHLNFGTNWTAEWRHNNELISADTEHSFLIQNGAAALTVSRFFSTDNGLYDCQLKRADNTVFRQKSSEAFSLKDTPVIRVKPVRKNVRCGGDNVTLQCSVNSPYEVELLGFETAVAGVNITVPFSVPASCTNLERNFTCQTKTSPVFKKEIVLELSGDEFVCSDPEFGDGIIGFRAVAECEDDKVGEKTAVCKANGEFEDRQDNCVLRPIQQLQSESENLNINSLPGFLERLGNVTVNFTVEVVESPATIRAISDIFNNVANTLLSLDASINTTSMEDVLLTAGVLTTDEAKESWDFINTNDTRNSPATRSTNTSAESVSSSLLQSLETITTRLTSGTFNIETPSILLNKTTFENTFNADFDSSVEINITEPDGGNQSITVLTFESMDNVLPARDEANSSVNVINGRVVLVQSNSSISNISFTFDITNNSLGNPQCVFWNFSLFDGLGGWDGEGCTLVSDDTETVTCNCNHLTSFSILMSPYSPDDVPGLAYVSYIGVGISMASLVICLIIEAVIWRKIRKNNTSYLRHVSIVNIAVSLLIANIWFIIGAAISDTKEENPPACSAATFFIHFFYLALFFWMLASALLLLYRAVSVFDGGLSKTSMLAIGFCLGYGAPLIIATITIAVTAPQEAYIQETGVCWLNWQASKALLAFVIPALLIVAINFVILLVVIYKMLRRRVGGDAAQAGERHVLVVIARSLAVLTPFFGLTWSLGVGLMVDPFNTAIHYSFAFFNSLQGFFILVFGTLLDKKVRSEIAMKSQTSRSGTRSTSAGTLSSRLGFFRKWKRRKGVYNISSGASNETRSFGST
ncbi:probable G-protein coupled receptor 116 [Stegastes partitus]|uniref:Probable G-protein coupled receptor 116 n=1 Tax=Stegastes partitus TaxID=144197 RepID=A0A9Y4NSF6_9TELE|nr:PREDICTED: probable G-protein coupled receptor 116 [Stegastes partitus]